MVLAQTLFTETVPVPAMFEQPPVTLAPKELSAEEKASLARSKEELAALRAELSRPVPVAHGLRGA